MNLEIGKESFKIENTETSGVSLSFVMLMCLICCIACLGKKMFINYSYLCLFTH